MPSQETLLRSILFLPGSHPVLVPQYTEACSVALGGWEECCLFDWLIVCFGCLASSPDWVLEGAALTLITSLLNSTSSSWHSAGLEWVWMRECWVSNKQRFPLPSCAYDSRVGGICVCPSMPPTETHFLLEAMDNKKLISCAFQFLSNNMFSL